MKLFLLLRPNQQSCHQLYGNSMAFRALLFSTQAAPTSATTPLNRMILRAEDPRASIVPILENWVQQDNEIKASELHKIIRKLHNLNRSNHALQILQWMGDKGGYELSSEDIALQLRILRSAITPLKRMIMRAEDPKASVVPILENWVQQGNEIKHSQLQRIIRDLPRATRFNHALQILQWMGDKGGYELSAEDFAIQLELTSRVGVIEKVETCFDAIPYNLRGYEVYCALLRSYANLGSFGHGGCLEKGEATMEKLRELGFVRDASAYNVMLSFYYKMREYNKMNIIAEEMREKGINYNRITYNLLLKGNGDCTLIKRMEEVLTELEADPLVNVDWYQYLLAAERYWKSQVVEKALAMLKKSEESIEGDLNCHAFEGLVALYASIGSKADVYRLWSLYKPTKGFYHRACYQMCRSLIEVGDTDGAARIWKEWISRYSRLPKETIADMNDTWEKEVYSEIPRVLINRYRPEREKSEAIASRLRKSGREPDADTFDELAKVYCECEQMDKAVETLMKAISVSDPGWKPNSYTMSSCLHHLERQGDGGVAREELSRMLKERFGRGTICDELNKFRF